jgi:outer membrane receptor protein involved in Fe transport
MSKSYLKGSLLATTVIAGFAAVPAYAQDTAPPPAGATDTTAPGGATTPGDTQAGTTPNTGPGAQPQEAVPPAQGQGGEIIVTGTLIRNPNLTSSSPVAVVGQQEIQLRSPNSAEEILRTIPGVTPSLGQNVNNGAVGFANVDLRGLGPKRNLVMLDSTRIVPATSVGTVDLNNIPLALIDRVDVLTGGASTTYGADAVTGVVNFITKKNFAGVDIQATEQITERGDANNFRADLALGANFDDGRGNAVMSVGYIESDPLFFGDRPFAECVVSSITGSCSGDSATSTPTSFQFINDAYKVIGLDSTSNAFIGGVPNIQISPTGTSLVPQYSLFNFNPFNVYQIPFKRYNGFGQAHYDISDKVTVYGRALFSKNYTSSIIAPSGVFAEELTVDANNPFLPAGIRDQLCRLQTTFVPGSDGKPVEVPAPIALGPDCENAQDLKLGYVYRRAVEVGPRIDEQNTTMFDFKAGVTWNFLPNMSFDLYGAYGESEVQQRRVNYVAKSRLQQALNVNPSDPTKCQVATNGCVPLNLFGPPGSITREMAAFIGGVTSTINRGASLAQVHGVVSGDFGWSMPWAGKPVAFAIGAEHRDYTGHTRPDNLAQVPGELGGAGGAIQAIEGGYTAEDVFGELIVPIAADKPFLDELTLEGGYRHSHYTVDAAGKPKFSAETYKIGGTFAPIPEVKFRGNWQQAVRAPNIVELFAPVLTGLTALSSDPCFGNNPVVDATLKAICLSQGAPPGSIGSIPNPTAGQANVTTGGNPTLKPETAHTWTVGVVLSPRQWLPGFNATVDYYNIKIKDAIAFPLSGDAIRACFGADPTHPDPSAIGSAACAAIHRNASSGGLSGSVASVRGFDSPLTNSGKLATDGVDFTANYRHGLGFADLILNFAGNWTHKAKFWALADSSVPPNCPGLYSANCGIAIGQLQPKWSWNQRTTLSFKPVDVSLLWRHISSFKYQPGLAVLCDTDNPAFDPNDPTNPNNNPKGCTGNIRNGPFDGTPAQFMSIGQRNYFDLTTRFSITDHFDLTLAAYNILDKQPPIVGNNAGTTSANSGNTFPSTYDALGRRYSASVRLKF